MLIGETAVALNGYYRPSISEAGEIKSVPSLMPTKERRRLSWKAFRYTI